MNPIRYLLASILLVVCICPSIQSQQSVTVSWKGELNCQEITIDSVLVTNLSKSWTTTVFYPETSIILHTSMGIDELKDFAKTQIQVKPNPFSQTAEVDFYVGKECMVSLTLYDIFGRTVASLSQQMGCGQQQVVVNMGSSGYYFLSIETPSEKRVAKLLSMYDGNGDAGIVSLSPLTPFNSPSGGKSSPPSEGLGEASQKSDSDLPFDLGDSLQFMAYATDSNGKVHEYLPRIEQVFEDKEIVFTDSARLYYIVGYETCGLTIENEIGHAMGYIVISEDLKDTLTAYNLPQDIYSFPEEIFPVKKIDANFPEYIWNTSFPEQYRNSFKVQLIYTTSSYNEVLDLGLTIYCVIKHMGYVVSTYHNCDPVIINSAKKIE